MVGRKMTLCAAAVCACSAATAMGQMRISEYMYNSLAAAPNNPEFVEFTNVGTTPIDMTGWSYDDSSRVAGSQDLSAFGIVNPGESVILCEGADANFRAIWNLPITVDVIGNNGNNLGRSDEINLYDNTNTLVDRLTYNDQDLTPPLGGPRTQGISGWICTEFLGANNHAQVRLSVSGDVQGSYFAGNADIGNPGMHTSVLCLCGNNLVDASEECDGTEVANCASGICNADCTCQAAPVPTVSEWGLVILTLVGLTAGTLMFNRRFVPATA